MSLRKLVLSLAAFAAVPAFAAGVSPDEYKAHI
jgi:hypothetical protein